jgi:hypothetical protein
MILFATSPEQRSITVNEEGKKVFPIGTVFSKLRFKYSTRTGNLIAYVTKRNGCWYGVGKKAREPKQVVLVSPAIQDEVQYNTLYRVAMVPMVEKKGFVAIGVLEAAFVATVITTYVPNILYKVEVKWGNRIITFDPSSKRNNSISKIGDTILDRKDIKWRGRVFADFTDAAEALLRNYRRDGYY